MLFQYSKKKPKGGQQEEPQFKALQKAESTPNLSRSFTEAVLHTTGNTASILRSRCNREKVEIYEKSELLEKRKQLDSEMRQMEMRKNHPAWQKLRFSTQVVDHGIEAKKSQWKQTADERELDYKMELQKMKIRVESQPTLFERQSQVQTCSSTCLYLDTFFGEYLKSICI